MTDTSLSRRHAPSLARFRQALPLAMAALLFPLAAMAQLLPWIGLSGERALLLKESAQGGSGPGVENWFGSAVAAGDFNNDGHGDLAVGVPGKDCAFVPDCGLVQVRFGRPVEMAGVLLTLDPAAPAAPDLAEAGDGYGATLAVGDFDADGHADLAVGVPLENLGSRTDAGAVQIHYGRPAGAGNLQPAAQHFLHQDVMGIPSLPQPDEWFGRALAVGDFNGDGHDDLAIGAPRDKIGTSNAGAGNVVVVPGHDGGLLPAVGFELHLGLQGLPDVPEQGEAFGSALATGDFNGDTYDDLAIGVPGEDGIGAVLVVYGGVNYLSFANHLYFSQWDLNQTVDFEGRFGEALAAGDFDGDGYDDIAVGSPGFDGDAPEYVDMGMVAVLFGAGGGLSPAAHAFIWEDRVLGAGNSELRDEFGGALTAADFDGDGYDELAIGARLEGDVANNAGAVTVMPGHPQRVIGLSRRLRPNNPRLYLIPDTAINDSNYGAALTTGDFDGNGYVDLAIGAPLRNGPGDPVDAGAVALVHSREASLFQVDFEPPPEI